MNSSRRLNLSFILLALILLLFGILYSYRITQVPTGLTIDEAAFGYNAVLLSRTAHDQNGRFLPFFVLSLDGRDWRQPVTQYYLTLLFKIFSPSVFLLRFSSVIVALTSAILLYLLAFQLFQRHSSSLFTTILFLASPILALQARLGLDNIMVVPFTIVWLIGLLKFYNTRQLRFLIISALSLGISFYTYKGMRAIVPVWATLSCLWLFFSSSNREEVKGKTKTWVILKAVKARLVALATFAFTISPFFAVIPLLNRFYAGAVMGGAITDFRDFYNLISGYLANFDFSFLFVQGDLTLYHSTGKHGMLLLAALPLILAGAYFAVRQSGSWCKPGHPEDFQDPLRVQNFRIKTTFSFWQFILLALVTGPLLFGSVGSVHRASRLMALLPLYSLLAGLTLHHLISSKFSLVAKRLFVSLSLIIISVNFFDFYRYYLTDYAQLTSQMFGHLPCLGAYRQLRQLTRQQHLEPLIEQETYSLHGYGEPGRFFQSLYFDLPLRQVDSSQALPADISSGLLLTHRQQIPGFQLVQSYPDTNCYLHQYPAPKI